MGEMLAGKGMGDFLKKTVSFFKYYKTPNCACGQARCVRCKIVS